jgi:hypothetical protein
MAVRLFVAAFASQPNLAEDHQLQHRYSAACAAALAGCGRGRDAAGLDEPNRVRLRGQALAWLQAEFALCVKLAGSNKPRERSETLKRLRHWQQDADLAGVRDPAALLRLTEPEREAWRKLWRDVEAMAGISDWAGVSPPV